MNFFLVTRFDFFLFLLTELLERLADPSDGRGAASDEDEVGHALGAGVGLILEGDAVDGEGLRAGVDGEIVGPEGQEEVAVAVLWVLGQGDGGSLQVDDDRSRAHIDHLAIVVGGRAIDERAWRVVGIPRIDQLD